MTRKRQSAIDREIIAAEIASNCIVGTVISPPLAKRLLRVLKQARADKARLDWLEKREIRQFGDDLFVSYMPISLEDGQTVRQGIDEAMKAPK